MAMIRNLALAVLRLTGHTEITRTLQRIAADRTRIMPILADFPATQTVMITYFAIGLGAESGGGRGG